MKNTNHLGQSITLGALLVLVSAGVISLVTLQSSFLP